MICSRLSGGENLMTNNRLYVGNLPFSVSSDDLRAAFAAFGEVTNATVIIDKASGRSKGFGFVEYADDDSAAKAIEAMNGKEMDGRSIVVNIARPMQPRTDYRPQR